MSMCAYACALYVYKCIEKEPKGTHIKKLVSHYIRRVG